VRNKARYTVIGYVVSKLVIPMAKRQARRKARGALNGTASAARAHPARTSIALGVAAGAVGWLLTRVRDRDDAGSAD
jgi:hypothetical protein